MKIPQILVIFCTSFLLTSSISTNFLLSTSSGDKKLSNYVCKITKDITKSKSDTQDVLIGNLGGKVWSSTVNDIAECVGQDSAVVVSDFKAIVNKNTLRKAGVIVLLLKDVTKIAVTSIVMKHHSGLEKIGTVWHHMAKVIVVVPKRTSQNRINEVLKEFTSLGFLDVACVHETEDGNIQTENFASLSEHKVASLNPTNSSLLFPDKLKDMEGYPYKVAVYSQIPRVIIRRGKITAPLVHFMSSLEKHQNATVQYSVVRGFKDLYDRWLKRSMDLTFNTGMHMLVNEKEFVTYEQNGFCAIVPLPPKVPLFQSIFIKPFDGLTWLFFVLTMACSVAVWSLFRGRGAVDSPWLLAYGMVVMFIGQGVNFSRKNRLVLAILLQLIILMIFLLSANYEGVITSFMIQPIQENRFQTFDQLVASDFKIFTSDGFAANIEQSESYQLLKSRLNTSGPRLGDHFRVELQRARYTFIMNCDEAEVLIPVFIPYTKIKVSDLYYILPQKFYPYIVKLPASYLNPFLERLQYYMDLSFQAGLPYIWQLYASFDGPFRKSQENSDELTFLKFEDLTQVFGILIIGYVLSTLVLLIEIFFHDALKNLKLAYLARKLRNRVHQMAYKKKKQPKHPKYQKGALYYIMHRHKKVKRLQPKRIMVRRIFVQPRFPDGCSEE